MAKLPSFQFYPGDWLKDPALRRCSLAAKGFWIDMLCLMFECDERGVLATSGLAWTDEEIIRAVGGEPDLASSCLRELLAKGVLSRRSPSGAYFSRRMVRDEEIRRARAKAGSTGGKATQSRLSSKTQANHQANGKQNTEDEDEEEVNSSRIGGIQGGPEPPPFEHDIGGIGLTWAQRIYAAYPRQAKRESAFRAIAKAANALRARGHPNPPAFLLERVEAFARSDMGKAGNKFCPLCDAWMDAGRYDDDESEWSPREPDPAEARRKRDRAGERLAL